MKRNNINVAGFDIQRTGNNFNQLFTTKEVSKEDSLELLNFEVKFSEAKQILSNRRSHYDSIKTSIQNLIFDYEQLKMRFDADYNETKSNKLINRTLCNRIHFLKYMLDWQKTKDWNARWKARDSAMADNVSWLITNFFPNEKVIIIAHNFHIAKYNKKEEVMGEFLKSTYGDDIYSLGVFASIGSYSNNSEKQNVYQCRDLTRLDIKHIINSLAGNVNFLDIPKSKTKLNTWLFNDIIVNDTFINLSGDNEMILSKHFDGLLLLDTISVPNKI
ncbi:erythromycin esterase family protein [Lacinutrix neustonica]|uniref:Erythromycin esterase family protein n=1 Tax=Lacinutrix neustonica TaxID=2980107 RepID=A0A9E8MXN1_9FLAO|nr:erythromycin esterase family protein [Lacinutrix neustonica]WAC02754.1 erythromycin esterase family protein [Lacinutrix neustonica]